MRVATKLGLGFGALIGLMVVLLVYHVSATQRAVRTSQELAAVSTRLTVTSSALRAHLHQLEEDAVKYFVTGDPRYADRYEQSARVFSDSVARLRSLPLTGAESREVDSLSAEWARFMASHVPLDLDAALTAQIPTSLDAELERLIQSTEALRRASASAMLDRIRASIVANRRANRVAIGAVVVALIVSAAVSSLILRPITSSLHRLLGATEAVAAGNFSVRLKGSRHDEFAEVARGFNEMGRRLKQAERTKREFLSKVSHDLKSPLASVHEVIELLLEETPGELGQNQVRLLRLARKSAARLSERISKLVDLAALQSGAVRYEMESRDLVPLCAEAAEQYQVRLGEAPCRLATTMPPYEVPVRCDAKQIYQLLENLLENAIKHSPAGGTVYLRVERCQGPPADVPPHVRSMLDAEEELAIVSVSDEGPGVPHSERERIFEMFHQAASRVGDGVGLGLAICREIAVAHGGAVWVGENRPVGSTFKLSLPCRASANRFADSSASTESTAVSAPSPIGARA